jgi:uncharacterized damage-inducible protein DinB
MFRSVEDFLAAWQAESKSTLRVFGALSDDSLAQSVVPGGYSLGSLAAHITGSIAKIPAHAGLLPMPMEAPAPASVAAITAAYEHNAQQVADAVAKQWSDAQLGEEIPMFGRTFRRGAVLTMLISHQGHHRAQMTVLMRQAGLKVPGVYGPSQDDLAAAKALKE